MRFGVVITTYQRKDGKTFFYLNRAIDSVLNQSYKDFKVFLIGDRYDDNVEFEKLSSRLSNIDHYYENLHFAHERDVYGENKQALWSYGGTYATNYGIDLCEKENIEFVAMLNHDDWWYENHLEEFYKCYKTFNCDFMCTKSTFTNPNIFLPNIIPMGYYTNFLPSYSHLIHSSAMINIKKIPLRYVDIFKKTGKVGLPGDGDYWNRVNEYIKSKKLCGLFINTLTCRHDEEGHIKK